MNPTRSFLLFNGFPPELSVCTAHPRKGSESAKYFPSSIWATRGWRRWLQLIRGWLLKIGYSSPSLPTPLAILELCWFFHLDCQLLPLAASSHFELYSFGFFLLLAEAPVTVDSSGSRSSWRKWTHLSWNSLLNAFNGHQLSLGLSFKTKDQKITFHSFPKTGVFSFLCPYLDYPTQTDKNISVKSG